MDEPDGWRAYFCTDTKASAADILGMVADRFSLEIAFRECKQVVGAGRQRVRFLWANVGAFHVRLWTYTMTEVGFGAGRTKSWWTARPRRGTRRHGGRATRTSGGRGVVNYWARRFVRFHAREPPRRKSGRRPKGCSAWPREVYILPESTVKTKSL